MAEAWQFGTGADGASHKTGLITTREGVRHLTGDAGGLKVEFIGLFGDLILGENRGE